MRRIAATLLVVASPAVLAVPVGAGAAPGVPVPATAAAPGAPAPVAAPAPVPIAVPPAIARVTPAVPAPAVTAPAGHRAVRTVGVRPAATTGRVRAGVDDALYTERLQAELCLARAIFCGVDHTGHYRAG